MWAKNIGLSIVMIVVTSAAAQAAQEFAVSVTGAIQGPFKGEMLQKGFEGKFAGLSFDQELQSPRDAATGQATQKRQHKPIRIKKAWGPASLQLFAAVLKNESLTVTMDFFSLDPKGLLVLDHTVKLTNASVASYKSHADSDVNPVAPQTDLIEFVFQQIELTDHRGKGTVIDSLSAP